MAFIEEVRDRTFSADPITSLDIGRCQGGLVDEQLIKDFAETHPYFASDKLDAQIRELYREKMAFYFVRRALSRNLGGQAILATALRLVAECLVRWFRESIIPLSEDIEFVSIGDDNPLSEVVLGLIEVDFPSVSIVRPFEGDSCSNICQGERTLVVTLYLMFGAKLGRRTVLAMLKPSLAYLAYHTRHLSGRFCDSQTGSCAEVAGISRRYMATLRLFDGMAPTCDERLYTDAVHWCNSSERMQSRAPHYQYQEAVVYAPLKTSCLTGLLGTALRSRNSFFMVCRRLQSSVTTARHNSHLVQSVVEVYQSSLSVLNGLRSIALT